MTIYIRKNIFFIFLLFLARFLFPTPPPPSFSSLPSFEFLHNPSVI